MMVTGKKEYIDEYVLVFPVSILRDIGYFNGITFLVDRYLNEILNPENYEYMNRNRAEADPNFKQVIPYCILLHNGSVFSYRRGKLMSEKRLRGNYSIGIGGHISVTDPGLFDTTFEEGMKRELNEEVSVNTRYSERRVALINDDSNEVGKVHFGIVHVLTLESPDVKPKEKSVNEAQFVSIDDLRKNVQSYETWSQFCIHVIEELLY